MYLFFAIYLFVGLVATVATSREPAKRIESDRAFFTAATLVTLLWPIGIGFQIGSYLASRKDDDA